MKSTRDIANELARRYRNRCQRWLAGGDSWPTRINLDPPTQAQVERDVSSVRQWATDWANVQQPGKVIQETRRWGRIGEQRLPVALELGNPAEAAAWAGEAERYTAAQARHARLCVHWSGRSLDGLERHFDILADYTEDDFQRLVAVLDWLLANPGSNLYLRQLPIEGIDTKWIETRKGLVVRLLGILRGEPGLERDFYRACGLRRKPASLRVRVLCPSLRGQLSGLSDLTVPLDELAALGWRPTTVLVVENLESGLALPDLPGAVALMGKGWAVSDIVALSWVERASILYWGDIDTHGLAMLAHLRTSLPDVRSMLMDESTLLAHRQLWAAEPTQHAATHLAGLTPEEQALYTGLKENRWGPNVRLEQERLAWPEVLAALERSLETSAQAVPGIEKRVGG